MGDLYFSIVDFIYDTNWPLVLFRVKVFSGIISALFLVGIVILAKKINIIGRATRVVSESVHTSTIPKRRMIKKWEEIQERFNKGDDANMRLAVIEVDKMFDELLLRMGYHGDTMGERLEKVTPGQFPRLQEIWDAHKLRNRLVHDPDVQFTREDAARALETYKGVLNDLEVI